MLASMSCAVTRDGSPPTHRRSSGWAASYRAPPRASSRDLTRRRSRARRHPNNIAKRSFPIRPDRGLRLFKAHRLYADLFVQCVFQAILHMRVPCAGVGLRPEIAHLIGAGELAADKVIDLIGGLPVREMP